MSDAIVVTSRILKSRNILSRVDSVMRRAIGAGLDAWQARRDRQALMAMPDHLLKDIGFARDCHHRIIPWEERWTVGERHTQC